MSFPAAVVASINISDGGVPKLPVPRAIVTRIGIQGDGHRYPKIHGGVDRALCLYSAECIERLRSEGHDVCFGTLGENVTVRGLDWGTVVPGVRLAIVNVLIEVVSYASPCKTIARFFLGEKIDRVQQADNPGWSRVYARVLQEGSLSVGDRVTVLQKLPCAVGKEWAQSNDKREDME